MKRMKKICIVALLTTLIFTNLNSQNKEERFNKEFNTALSMMTSNNFTGAVKILKKLYKADIDNPKITFNLANCYLNTSDGPDSAVIYFEKALKVMPQSDYNSLYGIELHMALAKSYQFVHNPQKALHLYDQIEKAVTPPNPDLNADLEEERQYCNNAIELMKKPVQLTNTNMGAIINSKNDDHSPLVTADESLFVITSRRPSSTSELMDDGQYAERIYISKKKNGNWTKPQAVKSLFKKQGHEAAVNISADGRYLYIMRNDMNGVKLYVSEFDGDTWSVAEKMPAPISSRFDETHISFTGDGSTAYFTSNRPGGLGGFDIYRTRLLPDNTWGVPQNLGPSVNSAEDEESPMIHPDGKTLYFSSLGHNTMGGFDIFYSQELNDSTWTEAVNIGYPINSADDDVFFVPSVRPNRAYYSSSRFADKVGGVDIYEVEYEEPEDSRLMVLKGIVDSPLPLDNVRIHVTSDEQKLAGIYKPHPVSGEYVMILDSKHHYTAEYFGAGVEHHKIDLKSDLVSAYKKKHQVVMMDKVELQPDEATLALLNDKKEKKQSDVTKELDESDGIPWYTVQIMSVRTPADLAKSCKGLDVEQIVEYRYRDGWYVYSVGLYKGYKAAVEAKQELIIKTRFKDSFVRNPKQYIKFIEESKE